MTMLKIIVSDLDGTLLDNSTMFSQAYYSYAMANAPEEVKKQAKYLAESSVDHGVIRVISHQGLQHLT
jgi:hydroxymethylpyrimidine pyrophosphatase-like HAD family hydrolase